MAIKSVILYLTMDRFRGVQRLAMFIIIWGC